MEAPDPLDHALDTDDRLEDAQACQRGARLLTIADALIEELVSNGYLPARFTGPARVHCFTVLADHLFGNAAIEIPRGLGLRSVRHAERTPDDTPSDDAA